jgi:hypothetical protein
VQFENDTFRISQLNVLIVAAVAIPAVGGEQGPSNGDVRPLPPRSSLPRKKKTTPSAKTTVAERYRKSLGKLIGTGTPATRPLFG